MLLSFDKLPYGQEHADAPDVDTHVVATFSAAVTAPETEKELEVGREEERGHWDKAETKTVCVSSSRNVEK